MMLGSRACNQILGMGQVLVAAPCPLQYAVSLQRFCARWFGRTAERLSTGEGNAKSEIPNRIGYMRSMMYCEMIVAMPYAMETIFRHGVRSGVGAVALNFRAFCQAANSLERASLSAISFLCSRCV